MKGNVITVRLQMPMNELRKTLWEKRVSGTPVIDQDQLVGIISFDDFIRWMAEREPDCIRS
ncbi:MAG: CBS domain-containing protein [Planctomycetota bacterium]|jgi:predicted transcriptional regulator